MILNMGGGGGAVLNFKVVAYDSEEALLASTPAENTIGVVTTTTISSWVFSTTEPTNPKVGMVWISTGATSSAAFNALKDNELQVYPLRAKQYISNAWSNITAQSYQGGKWAKWAMEPKYLYNKGDECTDITGGWNTLQWYSGATLYSSGCKKNADSLSAIAGTTYGSVGFRTKNKIDLTDASTIKFVAEVTRECYFAVSEYSTNVKNREAALATVTTSGTISLDVSALIGSYYVCFGEDAGNPAGAVVTEVIMS